MDHPYAQGAGPPGPALAPPPPELAALAAAVDGLCSADPGALPDAALAEHIRALSGLLERAGHALVVRIAQFDARGAAGLDGSVSTQAWLRGALRLSPTAAARSTSLSRTLPTLPHTSAAWAEGAIGGDHAQVIASIVATLATELQPEAVADAEAVLADTARQVGAHQLRAVGVRLRDALAPEALVAEEVERRDRRYLRVFTTFDDMVAVEGLLDPESGALLFTALDALTTFDGPGGAPPADARRGAGPAARTSGQRRADALVDLARLALRERATPTVGGQRPHLVVTVELATLLRSADTSGGIGGRAGPGGITASTGITGSTSRAGTGDTVTAAAQGDRVQRGAALARGRPTAELAWAGPISGAAARRLACDAGVTRIITSGDSLPLDVGRTTYSVPPWIRRALVLRDGGCSWNGCDRPPEWTEAHHVVHWAQGGATALHNLALLCTRHHHAVHEGGWTMRIGPSARPVFFPPGSGELEAAAA